MLQANDRQTFEAEFMKIFSGQFSKIFASLKSIYSEEMKQSRWAFVTNINKYSSGLSKNIRTSIQLLSINEHCQMINAIAEPRNLWEAKKKNSPRRQTLTIQLPSIFRKKIFFPNFKYK